MLNNEEKITIKVIILVCLFSIFFAINIYALENVQPLNRNTLRIPSIFTTNLKRAKDPSDKTTGYYRVLKVVNVGGQELTVIDEEKIDTGLIEPEEVVIADEKESPEVSKLADEELRLGRVGLITVGGGMSSRAGISYPKGETPISPLSKKALYQCMAEEILAAKMHYGKTIPWYIMTSGAMGNDESTRRYFKENNYFGLEEKDVIFVKQESVGALESGTEKAAMIDKNENLTVPNGHGGVYKAMRDSNARTDGGKISALEDARTKGVRTFLYTHVDNALPVVNKTLLGLHLKKRADYTTTLVKKRESKEGLAMVAKDKKTGRKFFVEYNQPAASVIRDKAGFEYGSINRNIFSIDFFSSVEDPPFHIAAGKKARIYKDGMLQDWKIDKFERFVFDTFGEDKNAVYLCVGLPREECFATFKEMTGPDSPEVVGRKLSDYDKKLVAGALPEIIIPETATIELPRSAHFLDPKDLAKKLKALDFESHLKENAGIFLSDDFSAIYDADIAEFNVRGLYYNPWPEGIEPLPGAIKESIGRENYDKLNNEFGPEFAKVVYELAGNIYRHSSGGKITISRVFKDGVFSGMSITSKSAGASISFDNFMSYPDELADYEGTGSFHQGLAIIMQYADEFSLQYSGEQGNIIKVIKWNNVSGSAAEKKINLNIELTDIEKAEKYSEGVGQVPVNKKILKLLSLDKGLIGKFSRKMLEELDKGNQGAVIDLSTELMRML